MSNSALKSGGIEAEGSVEVLTLVVATGRMFVGLETQFRGFFAEEMPSGGDPFT